MPKRSCIWLLFFYFLWLIGSVQAQTNPRSTTQLKERILAAGSFAKEHFGVAGLLIEGGERFSVHGADHFPMQSVYKLPIAMATLDLVDRGRLSLRKKYESTKAFISRDTARYAIVTRKVA
jgi:beta-lactamase class A